MKKERQSPEQYLQLVQEDERKERNGKLKIYLGAAPGVGKTYTMLHDALEERMKDLDIVIGVAESHGRKEIEAMIEKFEILPKQTVEYRGKELMEFDLDAALKRNPGLIIIDEMAHTNVPGLRHPKRWQDIKELLDRGINVYTTLNIQHIESVKDDVSQIIQAPIKETVPDSMIDMADTIELVDIPPEELLKRLKDGKIYIPDQAQLAVDHYFQKGNLIALRELALRTTAQFVGTQVFLYRQGKQITRIWPTKQKILACVGPGEESLKLIRAARRMASNFQAEWIAVYVDSPQLKSPEEKRNLAIQNLRLAQQLGAETRVLTGYDIVKTVLSFARERNVTQIMIWKHIRLRWRDVFFRSLVDEIVRNSGEIDIYIMTGEHVGPRLKESIPYKKKIPWKIYIISLMIVSLATGINFLLYPFLSTYNLIMVYFLGVIIIALFGKPGPSIISTLISILICNFLFIPSTETFAIPNIQYLFTFMVMLIVSQTTTYLTVITRRQAYSAMNTEHQTTALYSLSQQLASARGIDKLLDIGTYYISQIFDASTLALIPADGHLVIASNKNKEVLSEKEMSVAQWVYDLGQAAGMGTDTLPLSDALYIPLQGSQRVLGVLRIHPENIERIQSPDQMRLLEACANQIGLALEVDRLHEQSKQYELKEEIDRVRNALLQAVSHDLRTPVITIMRDAAQLIALKETLDKKKANKMGKDIYIEGEQLNRLMNNLLQIAYLEAESVKLDKQLTSLKELILHVLKVSKQKLEKRPIHTEIPEDLPLIPLDKSLIEDVFINLIDNAIKFTPPESPIEIFVVVQLENDKVVVSVEDRGPGIMHDEVEKLFKKFYRGRKLSTTRGLGLGLAICQKIIRAHGGEIWAENREQGGAAFRFTLHFERREV